MLIEIPVSRISRKILIHDYDHSRDEMTIIALPNSLLVQQLMLASRTAPAKTGEKICTVMMRVRVSDAMKKDVGSNMEGVGMYIHREHRQRMLSWILGSVKCGISAKQAIRNIYDHYDIDDDDFDADNIYRAWQRYVKHIRTRDTRPVPNEILFAPKKRKELPVVPEGLYANYVAESILMWMKERGGFDHHLLRCLRVYTMRLVGYRYADIAAKGKEWQGKDLVRMAQRWANVLETEPGHHALYLKIFGPMLASLGYDQNIGSKKYMRARA